MKKKKNNGIEALKRRYGIAFVSPWVFGILLFVIVPIFTTLVFSVSVVGMGQTGLQTTFVGFKHYYELLFRDPSFIDRLAQSLTSVFTSIPIIVSLSLILGVVLNQKFKGRMFVRGIFFLPVIISSGVVMYVLSGAGVSQAVTVTSGLAADGGSTASYMNAIDFTAILARLNLPTEINNLMTGYLADTFNLIWNCGVQTLLFIAGLQTIPDQLYEVGKVEGATAWESFWYITIPMLNRVLLLVLFYTMIEEFVNNSYVVDGALIAMRTHSIYDRSSAQLWIYFLCVGLVIGLVMLLYNKFCLKKWN